MWELTGAGFRRMISRSSVCSVSRDQLIHCCMSVYSLHSVPSMEWYATICEHLCMVTLYSISIFLSVTSEISKSHLPHVLYAAEIDSVPG